MFRLLTLLLPGLIPSWKFFKSIEPSPRVQWRSLDAEGVVSKEWQEFRPRPQTISLLDFVKRLIWNPDWNESLYLVSLSERLTLEPTEHSGHEIKALLSRHLAEVQPHTDQLQFRLVFVRREDGKLAEEITHLSEPFAPVGASN